MKIRIGKDITIKLTVHTNGEAENLQGRELSLLLITPMQRAVTLDYTIEGDNVIVARIPGTEQKYIGYYDISLWENYGKEGQTVLDVCKAFKLVEKTCMEDDTAVEGLDVEIVSLSGNMQVGVKGASAYEIAVENGFVGTVDEWLASLKGADGESLTYEDLTYEQIKELQKPATDAAQEVNEVLAQLPFTSENIKETTEITI